MRSTMRFTEANFIKAMPVNWDQGNLLELSKQKWIKKSMLLLVGLFIFTSVVLKAQSPQKINFQSIVRNTSGVIVSNKSVNFKITILSGTITGTPVYSETHLKTTDAIGLVSLQIGTGTVVSGVFSSIDWGNALHFIKLEADFTGGNTYVFLGTRELMSVPYAMYALNTDTASLNLTSRFAEKAPINNPTFTGTVSGIDKTMVGLGNVDNTTDASKPVSTATQTAINTKVNISDTMTMLANYKAALNTKFNKADFPSGSSANEILYWNGTNWVSLSPGTTGQVLTMSSTGLSWGCIVTNSADLPSTTPTLVVNTPLLTPITIATTGATGISNAGVSGSNGLPAGVSAAFASNTITISGTPTAAGTFNYSILLTGGCGTVSATGTITVSACPTTTINYNGDNYKTVGIGNQCWMAENLRTRKYNDGTDIPFDASGFASGRGFGKTWDALTSGAHTLYQHDSTSTPSNLTSYGYLYNWYAVDSKKLCPTGWDVPTDTEWTTLTTFIGTNPGTKLKKNDALWATNEGTDDYLFSALPGGYRGDDGSFGNIRDYAVFWSATESVFSGYAWNRYLYDNDGVVGRGGIFNKKSVGASIRCLKE